MWDNELEERGGRDAVWDEIAKLRLARGLDAGQALPAVVADSWKRCLADHRLLPDRMPRAAVFTQPEIRDIHQTHGELLSIAEPEIEKLFLRLMDSECLVSLASPTGAMILFRCDYQLLGDMSNFGVLPGSVWTEEQQGTNGVGTCLRAGKPVTIVGSHHYDVAIQSLTCLTAPVFGKFGAVESVVNVTTPRAGDERSNRLVQNIVEGVARRIENRYFGRIHKENVILRLSGDSECADLAEEARLALNQEGRIVAGTSYLSGFTGRSVDELIGLPANDVLELDVRLSSTRPEKPFPLFLNGKIVYASMIDPGYRVKHHRAEIPPLRGPTQNQASPPSVYKLSVPLAELRLDPMTSMIIERAKKLLEAGVPVIIKGESATGKTTLAHIAARRSFGEHATLIVIDCAASSDLAIADAVAQASATIVSGALILDRIDELGESGQAALLSVLENNPQLGSGKVGLITVAVNLDQLTHDGGLRTDLLHRLRGATIELSSLRASPDLNGTINDFLRIELAAQEKSGLELDEDARLVLANYHWPGNVRELRHALRHAVALADGKSIKLVHLPVDIVSEIARKDLTARSQAEASRIEAALRFNGGNVSLTAKHLGLSRATLYRKVQIEKVRREAQS
jgi:sigma-54 dependent transcriptional regulator, acetoin dehydrogenase operon transcriptional activator AcoR